MLSCMIVQRHPRASVKGVDLVTAIEMRIQMACGAIRGLVSESKEPSSTSIILG